MARLPPILRDPERMPYSAPARASKHLICAVGLLVACTTAGGDRARPDPPDLSTCVRLRGDEIRTLFHDVEDHAVVHDGARGSARNRWCADGTFVSRWTTANASGVVEGRWHVEGDLRCVEIEEGLPGGEGVSRCGPLFRCGDRVASVNADGGVHGLHTLHPSACPSPSR